MSELNVKIIHRNDTAINWSMLNPILASGEIGLETDTQRGKVGDGTTAWNSLKYAFTNDKLNLIQVATFADLKLLPLVVGNVYYITDSTYSYKLWIDTSTDASGRVTIPVFQILTDTERLNIEAPLENQFYFTSDTKELWRFNNTVSFIWNKVTITQLLNGTFDGIYKDVHNPLFVLESELNDINHKQGQTYIATDTSKMYIDISNYYKYLYCPLSARICFGDVHVIDTEEELNAIPIADIMVKDYYYVKDIKAFCMLETTGVWGSVPAWAIFCQAINFVRIQNESEQ